MASSTRSLRVSGNEESAETDTLRPSRPSSFTMQYRSHEVDATKRTIEELNAHDDSSFRTPVSLQGIHTHVTSGVKHLQHLYICGRHFFRKGTRARMCVFFFHLHAYERSVA